MALNTGFLVPLTALIFQTTLFSKVLCVYPTKESNKVNCDEPFQFCSNKRPSSQPGSCSRNGGYPGDLTFNDAAYADYSQYRGALALKPCFNKEMEEMGFEGEDNFRTIDVFTDNNFRRKPDVNYGQWNSVSEGYGGYGRYKRQLINSDQFNVNAIAVVFEEPGARQSLIEYLDNPEAPERACFNDSYNLDGKELYKRLCLPEKIKTYGSESADDEMTFDQCTLDSEDEQQTVVKKRHVTGPIRRISRQGQSFATVYRSRLQTLYSNTRILKPWHRHVNLGKKRKPKAHSPKSSAQAVYPKPVAKFKPIPQKVVKPIPIALPSYPAEPKPSYGDEDSAPETLKPPTQLYGMRIRQRSVYPCSKYKSLCDSLEADGKVVDCGGIRFSKCNSQWENCIGPDEKFLRGKTDYYKKYYGDTCPSYNPNDESDPYPGQPFFEEEEQPKTDSYLPPSTNSYHQDAYIYNPPQSYSYPHNRRQGEEVQAATNNCRKWTNNGNSVVCDENIEIRNTSIEELNEIRDNLGPMALNPEDDRSDGDDFDE